MIVEEAVSEVVPQISAEVTILPVSYATILDDPAAPALLRAYAEECLVPDASPQRAMYEALEKLEVIQCFGAYLASALIGFISIIRTTVPHDGHLVASVESMFVDLPHRHTGAGLLLLTAAETFATDIGCRVLLCSARLDSPFDLVLSRRAGYERTHSQHTRWLNGYKGGRE